MKNPFKAQGDYPQYYRSSQGVYCKVTGPSAYTKCYWLNKKMNAEEVTVDHRTCAEIFQPPQFHKSSKKKWEAMLEPLAAANMGVRNSKPIEFVFELEGVKYWRYKNIQDYPVGRVKELEGVIMEMNAQLDADALGKFFTTLLGLLGGEGGTISIPNIAALVVEVDNRRKLAFDTNIWRRLGTVIFFTQDEDTSQVAWEAQSEKLKAWEVLEDDFFLKTPLRAYFPFGDGSTVDLQASLQKAKANALLSSARLGQLYKNISMPAGANSPTGQRKPE